MKLLPLSDLLPQTVDGLIFSAPLVPPTLDGRKSVTRRMSKKWLRRKKGDLIFVRETWRAVERETDSVDGILFRADDAFVPIQNSAEAADRWCAAYDNGRHGSSWRPSLLLPRFASRCVLRLTEDPREERVQEITEEECIREGMALPPAGLEPCPCEGDIEEPGPHLPHCLWRQPYVEPDEVGPYVAAFVCTWTDLHTKPGERWSDNPTIVRIAYERAA